MLRRFDRISSDSAGFTVYAGTTFAIYLLDFHRSWALRQLLTAATSLQLIARDQPVERMARSRI
jgi:hypothetical protein